MHWTGGESGGVDYERELKLVEGNPSEFYFLSAADTELALAHRLWKPLLGDRLRIVHAGALRQPVAADDFIERHASKARLVVARLLGGESYYPHFIQGIRDCDNHQARWVVLSGADIDDITLREVSDLSSEDVGRLFELFRQGGMDNFTALGQYFKSVLDGTDVIVPDATAVPNCFEVEQWGGEGEVWVIGYRAWSMAGDTEVMTQLSAQLRKQGMGGRVWAVSSLKDPIVQQKLLDQDGQRPPSLLITLQSFSVNSTSGKLEGGDKFLESFGVPLLQVPCSVIDQKLWQGGQGLPPAEVAINIALPELDGRVVVGVGGFKEPLADVVDQGIKRWRACDSGLEYVALLSQRWIRLQQMPASDKRVALILSNYPNRDGRIGNGVGLDTPASVVALLRQMQEEGYDVGDRLLANGDELIAWLQEGITLDSESSYGKKSRQRVGVDEVRSWIAQMPQFCQDELAKHWGGVQETEWEVPGIMLGKVFVGLQPPRGFTEQTSAIYHSPDLPPSPAYLAFYGWIREIFKADVMVEVGKHGNLEWLPGRATGMGPGDYSWHCLGAIPFLYSFIVNNPGEGTQAKRRCHAVIVDHLTPPLTRAGLYGDLEKAERLLEEHAHVSAMYPARKDEVEQEINDLLASVTWAHEWGAGNRTVDQLGSFLCDLKESRIRSGLHILGASPEGEKRVDFVLSLIRSYPAGAVSLSDLFRQRLGLSETEVEKGSGRDQLEEAMREWVRGICFDSSGLQNDDLELKDLRDWVIQKIIPRLEQCRNEIDHLLNGMRGRFVPPGPAGSPTRGRLDVLPTGRNFYALDPRIVPTPISWRCGKDMADRLLERHRQESGEYPRTVTMVVWGTSNMRTGGDDLAQAIWLWGCEPVWEAESGRVIDFKIIPVSLLGRPRVDVTLRVSGLFRDAFAETVQWLAAIPKRLAFLDEPEELNPMRAAFLKDRQKILEIGKSVDVAERESMARIFCSAPGAYGSGMLPLIAAGNWKDRADLAEVFVRWGDHALHADGQAESAPEALRERLRQTEVVHQNQDNREHDILDSDDYFQFQGGLHAAVHELRGQAPATYHGDSSDPDQVKVRTLREEFVRVLRSRVLNPKWIQAMRQHGYKGAFEMAATVDYLFGYDATCDLVESHQYNEVAKQLLLDPAQQDFFKKHNPHALKESTERMLEAVERGMWENPDPQVLEGLQQVLMDVSGAME